MIGTNQRYNPPGFTLIELLAVVGILGVMMVLGMLVWNQTAPAVRLDSVIQSVQQNLNYARNGAIQTGNDWMVVFDLENHKYYVANDDGWLGTVTELDQYGRKRDPRNYFLGSSDFDVSKRNNHALDANEMMRGPFTLGKQMFFMSVNNKSVTKVMFHRDGGADFEFLSGSNAIGEVWIATAHFMQISKTDPGTGTTDDHRWRKAIRIVAATGMTSVTENY